MVKLLIVKLELLLTESKLYIDSKLLKPVYEYTMAEPNKIIQELKPPNKKYFNPALLANLVCLNIVAKIYKQKDCN